MNNKQVLLIGGPKHNELHVIEKTRSYLEFSHIRDLKFNTQADPDAVPSEIEPLIAQYEHIPNFPNKESVVEYHGIDEIYVFDGIREL